MSFSNNGYITKFVNDNVGSVIQNRTCSLGIALTMVLLYQFDQIHCYPGFLGVGIFLFLSAYGLCKSIEKNAVVLFYKHRVERVVPMYLIMGVGICLGANYF